MHGKAQIQGNPQGNSTRKPGDQSEAVVEFVSRRAMQMAGLLRPPSITSFLTYRLIHALMALIGYADVIYLCVGHCHGLGVSLKKEYQMSSIPGLLDNVGSQSRSTVWKDKVMPVLLAGGLGLVLLYGAAFAETSALHNAAHDARHSAAFPCH